MNSGGKFWNFTLYDITVDKILILTLLPTTGLIFQHELCPRTRRVHLQGFLILPHAVRRNRLKKILALPDIHLEIPYSSPIHCWKYCMKARTRLPGTNVYISGTPPAGQGSREDLNRLHELCKQQADFQTLLDAHFGLLLRYPRGISSIRLHYYQSSEVPEKRVIVHWGEPGTGKTTTARNACDNPFIILPRANGVWWDGYTEGRDVIIEDYDGYIPWSTYLAITDKWAILGETKGGFVQMNSATIYITSNAHPREWYEYGPARPYSAVHRRIWKIVHFVKKWSGVILGVPDLDHGSSGTECGGVTPPPHTPHS